MKLDLNYTVGALQAAIGISGFLLGCSTIQTYIYYKNYPHDPKGTRYLVTFLWILEMCQQIVAMHAVYTMSVTNWGNVIALLKQPSTISATFYLGIIIPPLVESFYLWRIYKLFGKAWPTLVGVTFSWIRYAGWLLFAIQETKLGYVSGELFDDWTWLLIVLLVGGALLNVSIATAMLYYLYGQRNMTVMMTKILVDRLIMWTIQTGLITGITYIATLIAFLTMRDTLVWMAILACTTKIFSNCLLSSLNARPIQLSREQVVEAGRHARTESQSALIINISREQAVVASYSRPTTPMQADSGKILHVPPRIEEGSNAETVSRGSVADFGESLYRIHAGR